MGVRFPLGMTGLLDRLHLYEPRQALYHDHRGRRIVADFEGSGTAVISSQNGLVWIEDAAGVVEIPPTEHQAVEFKEFGLVIAEEEAQTQVWMGTAAARKLSPGHQSAPPGTIGSVIAKPGVQVNQNHEILRTSLSPQLLSFWNGAAGDDLDLLVSESLGSRQLLSCQLSDADLLKSISWRVQNLSELELLQSHFSDGVAHAAACGSHLNSAHFNVQIPLNPQALILRKTYDRFHGRQRARVLVDGEVCGMWYEPIQDRVNRWGIGDFVIDLQFIHNKSEVSITVDPPSGTPLWSVSQFEVWVIEEIPLADR